MERPLSHFKDVMPKNILALLEKKGFTFLRPSQEKSIEAGLFKDENLLVCTPTASGKTLVGELASLQAVLNKGKKALYVVPLRALASEKYKQFKNAYPSLKVAISSGEVDRVEQSLKDADIIVLTSEKLDSLLRHHVPWLARIGVVVFDEVHLLNDQSRGPTLEVVITILRRHVKGLQMIGLSATIGNPKELAEWLGAVLIEDTWRPTTLHKGVYEDGAITYHS